MKKILMIAFMAVVSLAAYSQSYITAWVADQSNTPTNIRNAPNGKVVYKLDGEEAFTVDLLSVSNGWWKIRPEVQIWGDNDGILTLTGSKTGYWIHKSVLAFGLSGDPKGCLRVAPSKTAKAVRVAQDDLNRLEFEPLMIKGEWVKVIDKDKKYSGWIPKDRICYNPISTCP